MVIYEWQENVILDVTKRLSYLKSNGSITNREIAEKLSVPEKRSPLGNREINGMQYYKTIIVVLQK